MQCSKQSLLFDHLVGATAPAIRWCSQAHRQSPRPGGRIKSAAHEIDQIAWRGRLLIAAPRHVLVRTYQDELVRIDWLRIRGIDIEHGQRHGAPPRRVYTSRRRYFRIGSDQSEV